MGIDWFIGFVGFVELLVHSSWFVVQSSQPLAREEAMSNQEAKVVGKLHTLQQEKIRFLYRSTSCATLRLCVKHPNVAGKLHTLQQQKLLL
jgi:hypothetical protein